MEKIINIAVIVLLIAYVGIAIWLVWERNTVLGSLGTAALFIGGGFVILPVVQAIASFVCWAVAIILALIVIGAVFGS